jgi:hypothetical protein
MPASHPSLPAVSQRCFLNKARQGLAAPTKSWFTGSTQMHPSHSGRREAQQRSILASWVSPWGGHSWSTVSWATQSQTEQELRPESHPDRPVRIQGAPKRKSPAAGSYVIGWLLVFTEMKGMWACVTWSKQITNLLRSFPRNEMWP